MVSIANRESGFLVRFLVPMAMSAVSVTIILSSRAASLGIRKIRRLEPAVVFRG